MPRFSVVGTCFLLRPDDANGNVSYMENLAKTLGQLSQSEGTTDVMIHCRNKTIFKANKIVLSHCSRLLKNLLYSDCDCTNFIPVTYNILCPDFNPEAMQKVLEIIYTGNTSTSSENSSLKKEIKTIIECLQLKIKLEYVKKQNEQSSSEQIQSPIKRPNSELNYVTLRSNTRSEDTNRRTSLSNEPSDEVTFIGVHNIESPPHSDVHISPDAILDIKQTIHPTLKSSVNPEQTQEIQNVNLDQNIDICSDMIGIDSVQHITDDQFIINNCPRDLPELETVDVESEIVFLENEENIKDKKEFSTENYDNATNKTALVSLEFNEIVHSLPMNSVDIVAVEAHKNNNASLSNSDNEAQNTVLVNTSSSTNSRALSPVFSIFPKKTVRTSSNSDHEKIEIPPMPSGSSSQSCKEILPLPVSKNCGTTEFYKYKNGTAEQSVPVCSNDNQTTKTKSFDAIKDSNENSLPNNKMMLVPNKSKAKYLCPYCDKERPTVFALEQHKKKHFKKLSEFKPTEADIPIDCTREDYNGVADTSCVQGKKQSTEYRRNKWGDKKCPICSSVFKKSFSMWVHIASIHYKDKIKECYGNEEWDCGSCGKHFKQEAGLMYHLVFKHDALKGVMSMMTEQNKSKAQSTVHQDFRRKVKKSNKHNYKKIKSQLTRYKCNQCPAQIIGYSQMMQHMACKHFRNSVEIKAMYGKKEWECNGCCKRLYDEFSLLRHIATVHHVLEGLMPPIESLVINNKADGNNQTSNPKNSALSFNKPSPVRKPMNKFKSSKKKNLPKSNKLILPTTLTNSSSRTKTHFKCHLCPVINIDHSNIMFHLAKHHFFEHMQQFLDDSAPLKCKQCLSKFSHERSILRHIATVHKALDSLIPSKESLALSSTNNVQVFKCEICLKSYTKMQKLVKHLALTHFEDELLEDNLNSRSRCNTCSDVFHLKEDLLLHLSTNHKGLLKYLPELYKNTENTLHLQSNSSSKENLNVGDDSPPLKKPKNNNITL